MKNFKTLTAKDKPRSLLPLRVESCTGLTPIKPALPERHQHLHYSSGFSETLWHPSASLCSPNMKDCKDQKAWPQTLPSDPSLYHTKVFILLGSLSSNLSLPSLTFQFIPSLFFKSSTDRSICSKDLISPTGFAHLALLGSSLIFPMAIILHLKINWRNYNCDKN